MTNHTERSNNVGLLTSCIDTEALYLSWSEAPWDTAVFGYPVLQINDIKIRGSGAESDIVGFESSRDAYGSGIVSCRLSHEKLRESMLLEGIGFRFIEMLYQPELGDLQSMSILDEHGLSVSLALSEDLPTVLDAAGTAFRNERFHCDPRLSPALSDLRYQNWVRSSLAHPRQRLYVLRDGQTLIAFFVIENLDDRTIYWHLNAVTPAAQGKGYGRRAWQAMIGQAKKAGAQCVRSCIAARNHRVLNLYARLGFYFPPPLMTFHWVHSA